MKRYQLAAATAATQVGSRVSCRNRPVASVCMLFMHLFCLNTIFDHRRVDIIAQVEYVLHDGLHIYPVWDLLLLLLCRAAFHCRIIAHWRSGQEELVRS